MRLVFFTVFLCIGTALGLIEPIPLPASLEDCINYKLELNNGTGVPFHLIENLCLGKYVLLETPHTWVRNLTAEEVSYIQSLLKQVISETEMSIISGNRAKRSVVSPKRQRREVRCSDYKHWDAYAKAVKRLKFKEIGPNGRSRYDTIADIHMTAINSSHFGPNFLAWHRLYLLVLETALGVPIPYWDSTIDYEMDDPTESILWTKKYFGNGFGMVKTGPFAGFQTPSGHLIRNIGSDGSLFNKRDLNEVFLRSRLYKILEPTAEERVSLEGQHNSVHNWVDGQMNTQEFSAHDPVFWCHHAFVDYLWEQFRNLQVVRGIDPVIDIPEPPENVTFQGGQDPSVGLFGFYNRDGYSNRIANRIKYDPHPECPKCAGSEDLKCDPIKRVCISAKRHLVEYSGDRAEATVIANRMIEQATGRKRGNIFSEYMRDDRVRGDSLTIKKKKDIKTYVDYSYSEPLIPKGVIQDTPFYPVVFHMPSHNAMSMPSHNPMSMPSHNPMSMPSHNPMSMPSHNPMSSFIPPAFVSYGPVRLDSIVTIPNQGPHPQHKGIDFNTVITDSFPMHGSFSSAHFLPYIRQKRSLPPKNSNTVSWKPKLENTFFLNGKIDYNAWVFIPVKILITNSNSANHILYQGVNNELQTNLENTYNTPKCRNYPKIYVQAHGLDYFGKFKDYAVLKNDNFQISYVAIKKPSTEHVKTYVSAYDSCGNQCSTRCALPGIYPRVYKSCTGALDVSTKEPLMYTDVPNGLPASNDIPIIFVCDIM